MKNFLQKIIDSKVFRVLFLVSNLSVLTLVVYSFYSKGVPNNEFKVVFLLSIIQIIVFINWFINIFVMVVSIIFYKKYLAKLNIMNIMMFLVSIGYVLYFLHEGIIASIIDFVSWNW